MYPRRSRRPSRIAALGAIGAAAIFPTRSALAQLQQAGTLYVHLRASDASAGSATWTNQGTLGNFTRLGGPSLVTNVAGSGFAGVLFGGVTNDAYLGPNSVADIDGGGDRSIEVWAYNPSIIDEETMVSWGHRGTTRRDMAFNFGSDATWGAATHWADDVSWGPTVPSANAWHHLVYTYSNTVVRIYVDGALANSRTLAGVLNTFTNEPINLGCQIESPGLPSGVRSLPYGGYLNTVRIHGGVLNDGQVQTNYTLGPAPGSTTPPNTPTGLAGTPGYNEAWLEWNSSAGAIRYSLKRATNSGGPYASLATNLTVTSFLDTNLLTGSNYFYVVSAANFIGESTNSSPVSIKPGIPAQLFLAGTLHVDLRATNSTAGSASWVNEGALGGIFSSVGSPALSNDVAGTKIPGVFFNGTGDAYEGPNSVPDLDGGSDRSIEVWTYNPSIVQEETTVSWGHRGTTRRDMAFNFGNNAVWGAATHWNDDVSWAGSAPSASAWHHLAYTYANGVVRVYVDGTLVNTDILGGNLDTFPGEPINLACQRETALGARSLPYGGYLNAVRIHGGVLNPAQVQGNYYRGPSASPLVAVNDSLTLNPGAKALVPVLANDFVPSLFPATTTVVSSPSHGTAQAQPDGRILYTHDGGSSTSDQFNYVVNNSLGATSGVATVFVTISPALRLPNTTLTVPDSPPPLGYQLVDAFPGLVVTQALAMRTPIGAAYSNLLFFVERRGFISYINLTNPNPVRQVFLDVSSQVSFDNTAEGEMGLESMDFHPGFATNGYFFVTYMATGGNPYRERLARFTANPATLSVATNTQQIFFDTTKREFNHNAGDLHFGNDGYLYVSMGDEGDQYNVHTNAQRLDLALFSGILRLDVDKRPGSLEPNPPSTGNTVVLTIPTNGSGQSFYSIPPNNPFLGVTNYYGRPIDTAHLRGEYYAIGFRHPWRFSIDPATGEVWAGHVGQDLYESVDLVTPGANFGWPYYEGSTYLTVSLYGGAPGHPGLTNPPAGFVPTPPVWVYPHPAAAGSTDPGFIGLDAIGGVVYHGSLIPQLTNAYVFGDFDIGGNIWAVRRSNSVVSVERLSAEFGIGAYGIDPRNGDILLANYIQNKIRRLVFTDAVSTSFPQKLSDTGIFADLTTLTPNPGIVSFEPIIAFWSDYAIKRRWFCIPNITDTVAYATDANWTFPTGMKWFKHFDLETTRGNPLTKKRIETRVLVKTTNGVYGVSYQWNDTQTEAYLAPDGGTNFFVTVQDGTNTIQQQWEIPSRSGCQACHTPVAGFALSFNTRELNQTTNMNSYAGNQLSLLSSAGYFSSPVSPAGLPAFARAADPNYSLEYRVRSYLSENCIQCHQPGGAGASTWDARPWLSLAQTHLINGTLDNNGGDPLNKLIVPGDTNHSVLLQRVAANGFSRMPPLATHQLDPGAISLLTQWITSELTNRQDFAQWQLAYFGSTNNPSAAPTADPDSDGANNYYEFLTMTSPLTNTPPWKIYISTLGTNVSVIYTQLANRGFVVEQSGNLSTWSPWDVPGNQLGFGASNHLVSISGPLLPSPQYFRVRISEP